MQAFIPTNLPCIVTDCSEACNATLQQTVDEVLRYTAQSKTCVQITESFSHSKIHSKLRQTQPKGET